MSIVTTYKIGPILRFVYSLFYVSYISWYEAGCPRIVSTSSHHSLSKCYNSLMTKFILHGGFDKNIEYIRDEFFLEALKDTPTDVKIFLVFFAESEEYLQLRIKQCKELFNKNKGSKNLEFKMASEENFLEGCAWADVIFLSGGRTLKLLEKLKKFQNLSQIFKGKIVSGDSAGVNALGHYFYSKKTKEINEGLGILPFKIIVHYTDDMGNPLSEVEPNLDTVLLREYETKVFSY